jgi:hypothetical protein
MINTKWITVIENEWSMGCTTTLWAYKLSKPEDHTNWRECDMHQHRERECNRKPQKITHPQRNTQFAGPVFLNIVSLGCLHICTIIATEIILKKIMTWRIFTNWAISKNICMRIKTKQWTNCFYFAGHLISTLQQPVSLLSKDTI